MMMEVDGHDLSPYINSGGYTVSRSDLEGSNTFRAMDGKLHREYVTYKRKVEIKFKALTAEEWEYIEHTILRDKEWHDVTFEDFGHTATARMYSSSFNGTIGTYSGLRIGAAVNFIEE